MNISKTNSIESTSYELMFKILLVQFCSGTILTHHNCLLRLSIMMEKWEMCCLRRANQ